MRVSLSNLVYYVVHLGVGLHRFLGRRSDYWACCLMWTRLIMFWCEVLLRLWLVVEHKYIGVWQSINFYWWIPLWIRIDFNELHRWRDLQFVFVSSLLSEELEYRSFWLLVVCLFTSRAVHCCLLRFLCEFFRRAWVLVSFPCFLKPIWFVIFLWGINSFCFCVLFGNFGLFGGAGSLLISLIYPC